MSKTCISILEEIKDWWIFSNTNNEYSNLKMKSSLYIMKTNHWASLLNNAKYSY